MAIPRHRAGTGRLAALGPGVLYAAAAIGVSHVVQSTRAGATYGLAMVAIIVVVGIVKYPAIRFGSQYTAATGRSLPENYVDQGIWAMLLYLGSQLLSIWFVLAAIAITTAGLVLTVFGLDMSAVALAGWLMAGTATLLTLGHYRWLEHIGKALVFVLVVMVVVAAGLSVPRIDWSMDNFVIERLDVPLLLFVAAMAGWMPTPVDASILNSVWTSAKLRARGARIASADARFDFNLGYLTAMVLAIGFLILGVAVMHEPGIAPKDSPPEFAAQVIALFTETVGGWSFFLIGPATIAAMFSTLLTAMDGYPRQFAHLAARLRGGDGPVRIRQSLARRNPLLSTEPAGGDGPARSGRSLVRRNPLLSTSTEPAGGDGPARSGRSLVRRNLHPSAGLGGGDDPPWLVPALIWAAALGSFTLLATLLTSFTRFIDLTTTLGFVMAPIYAFLNHRAMVGAEVAEDYRPSPALRLWSLAGLVALTGASIVYLWIRFI